MSNDNENEKPDSPEQKQFFLDMGLAIRDAQVAAFTFAKSVPGEAEWLRSLFRNMSCTHRIIEMQMLSLDNKKGNKTNEQN